MEELPQNHPFLKLCRFTQIRVDENYGSGGFLSFRKFPPGQARPLPGSRSLHPRPSRLPARRPPAPPRRISGWPRYWELPPTAQRNPRYRKTQSPQHGSGGSLGEASGVSPRAHLTRIDAAKERAREAASELFMAMGRFVISDYALASRSKKTAQAND